VPTSHRDWGLDGKSQYEKKDQPQSLWDVGTDRKSFFFSEVDVILFTFISRYLRKKLREDISLIHDGIIPRNEYDCIVYICSAFIVFLLLICNFLKKEKFIENIYFLLSKQTYPAKGRTDPERAQSGSGVARPSGRPGGFCDNAISRFF